MKKTACLTEKEYVLVFVCCPGNGNFCKNRFHAIARKFKLSVSFYVMISGVTLTLFYMYHI